MPVAQPSYPNKILKSHYFRLKINFYLIRNPFLVRKGILSFIFTRISVENDFLA